MPDKDDNEKNARLEGHVTTGVGHLFHNLWPTGQKLASVFTSYGSEIALGVAATSSAGLLVICGYLAYSWQRANKDLPSRSDKRERMANQLLARGHATMDELLEASYGEWPPKGLDIIDGNEQRVKFVSLLGMRKLDIKNPLEAFRTMREELNNIAGRARMQGPREIAINSISGILKPLLAGRSNIASVLGHEAVHILQGDHFWRAEDIFDKDDALDIRNRLSDTRSNMLANVLFRKENLLPDVDLESDTDMPLSINLAYQSKGIEIQARIHQLMADGYQHWGVMPTTAPEVQISMMNMGLIFPDAWRDKLRAMPDFEEISEKFKYKPESASRHARNAMNSINYLQMNTLTEQGRTTFCAFGIPLLYGDLLEMYGDRYGCERFSHMVNRNRIYRENRMLVNAVGVALENDHELAALRKRAAVLSPQPDPA